MAVAPEKHIKSLRKKPQTLMVVRGWLLTITHTKLMGAAVLLISTNNRACKHITKCYKHLKKYDFANTHLSITITHALLC